MKNNIIELYDIYEPTLLPLLRLKPLFALRTGIFSEAERVLLKLKSEQTKDTDLLDIKNELKIHISRDENFYKDYLHIHYASLETTSENYISKNYINIKAKTSNIQPTQPAELIANIGKNIQNDVAFLSREEFPIIENPEFGLEGDLTDLWIASSAKVSPHAVIDTRNGPVIIDANVKISAFSLIRGPVYIGPDSNIDRVFIENSITGKHARLGGEISNSIIGDFSNKHHEGFLGHSLVGDWVNLGALTTTSDLKNNYGKIRLQFEQTNFDTKTIKFGSIIGDHVKTAIGTMLNTGTIIDFGSLIFTTVKNEVYYPHRKYYSPFSWGSDVQRYKFDRFTEDMKIIMARRNEKPDKRILALIQQFFGETN
ncbi:MAG: glucose-1-phosphate thymidylyltransferase [Leptospirales bacterium]